MSMMAFRITFFVLFTLVLCSCKEKQVTKSLSVNNKRLFEIKEVRRVVPNNSFIYYELSKEPFFELIIKNVSGFDLDYHYHKRLPLWVGSCVKYSNFPSTSTCMFFDDTSRVIKKNTEFIVQITQFVPDSEFYKYEYQGIRFQFLISGSNDLSAYLEDDTSKIKYQKKVLEDNNGRKKYGYPLEFIYSTSTGLFWEHYLLE